MIEPLTPGDLGTVAEPQVSLPTSPATPPTGTGGNPFLSALTGGAVNSLPSFSSLTSAGSSFLANGGLIVVGVILGIAALVVSQRQTIVQVGKTAARLAV